MLKKLCVKIISVFLSVSIILGFAPTFGFSIKSNASDISKLNIGDIIEFGSYPQTKVTDDSLINSLNTIKKNWTYFDFLYQKLVPVSEEEPNRKTRSDYMSEDIIKYADIEYGGEKYRAVAFNTELYKEFSDDNRLTNSRFNGYKSSGTYYFKYEPLKWRVIDPADGFVVSINAIDSRAFNEKIFYVPDEEDRNNEHYYKDETCQEFADDYGKCDLRDWLNGNFYDTSFTDEEKKAINLTECENSASVRVNGYISYHRQFDFEPSYDKVFLMSSVEIGNPDYGFVNHVQKADNARIFGATDYAEAIGMDSILSDIVNKRVVDEYWLRTPHTTLGYDGDTKIRSDSVVKAGNNNGFADLSRTVTNQCLGVVPAMKLSYLPDPEPDYTCGENAQWNFNEGKLEITGNGAVDFSSNYGWESIEEQIKAIEISDGITSLPDRIFSSLDNLTEVCFGNGLQSIGQNAFANCPQLLNVSFMSNTEIGNGSFSGTDSSLMFIYKKDCNNPESFAKNSNIKTLIVSFDDEKKILSFNGGIDVSDNLSYDFLNDFLMLYQESEYVFFDRLDFHNIIPNQIVINDDELDASINNTDLTLHNIYVSLSVLDADGQHQISFAKMLELLKNGNYDAFKLVVESDEKVEEKTFFEKIVDFFENIETAALKAISKVINFVSKLFKK